MSFGSAPKAPNPKKMIRLQREEQQRTVDLGKDTNRIGQQGAFGGSISYDPVTGAQKTQVGQYGQDAAAGLAGLGQQYYGMAGQGVPDSSGAFNQAYNYATANMQPRFDRQRSMLESKLRNQGLDPTSAAFRTAMQDQALTENEALNSVMNQAQQNMFNQGLMGRQQQISELTPGVNAAPGFMTPNVSPFAQVGIPGPVDAAGFHQQKYESDLANYNNQMSGWSGLAGMGAKLALAPVTGGGSLFGSFFGK